MVCLAGEEGDEGGTAIGQVSWDAGGIGAL